MQQHNPMTLAVIEIASNSISAVVGTATSERLQGIMEESTPIGFRASVQATGGFTPAVRAAALEAIRKFQSLASQHGAEQTLLVAHKAVRSADNRESFLGEIQRATGLECKIISGTLVAALAFYGVIYEVEISPDVGVLDVGPGSMEFICARERRITWLTSVPVGAGWLHDMYLLSNPPSTAEVANAEGFLRSYIPRLQIPQVPPALLMTGSSAKALLKLGAHQDRLVRADLLGYRELLFSFPAEAIAQRYQLSIERAQVLPAGMVLILAMLDSLHLDTIRLSALGLPQGVLFAFARYGEGWFDHPEVNIGTDKVGRVPSPTRVTL